MTVGGFPVQQLRFKTMLDLPAVGEVQREGLAVEIGEVGQDKGFWGESVSEGTYGDPVRICSHCMAPVV
ncbi:hypothetical protein D9M71_626410 [compost metagenome]